jgi:hypothetical protein
MEDPRKLRELAGWYREICRAGRNPAIWHARLTAAEDLEREADRLERMAAQSPLSTVRRLLLRSTS